MGPSGASQFGYLFASAGDVDGDGYADLIAGDPGALNGRGLAYLFLGRADGIDTVPVVLAPPDRIRAGEFGRTVESAGDVNGDGHGDVVVSAGGAIYVFLGGDGGLAQTPIRLAGAGAPGSDFGASVASAIDLNGDGFADLVVGAPGSGGLGIPAAAAVYLGSSAGTQPTSLDLTETLTGASAYGLQVASAGDVNGDGYDEVLVVAFAENDDAGRAYVFAGGDSGPALTPVTFLDGPDGNLLGTIFGFGIFRRGGDVNGDGYGDVVVGVPGMNANTGRVHLYEGSAMGLGVPTSTLDGSESNGTFGYSLARAGDSLVAQRPLDGARG